jgi:hypothetical protein
MSTTRSRGRTVDLSTSFIVTQSISRRLPRFRCVEQKMTDIRRVGDSGIHTVEGVVAGAAAAKYAREREIEQQKYEMIKNKIKENNSTKLGRIDDKFSSETSEIPPSPTLPYPRTYCSLIVPILKMNLEIVQLD